METEYSAKRGIRSPGQEDALSKLNNDRSVKTRSLLWHSCVHRLGNSMELAKDSVPWSEAVSLEELIRKAFEEKKENELVPMIKILPEGLREKCRGIWKQEQEKRKHGSQEIQQQVSEQGDHGDR